jgi:hypothetical protein
MQKIKLSLDYNTITVKQYVDFLNNEGNDIGQVSAIMGQSKDFVRQLTPEDIDKVINGFRDVIATPMANHQHKWNGYGFIPDINKISFGEWLDLDTNCKDFPKNLPKLLSILYRPITSEIGTKYKIEQYTADHLSNAKDFESMTLSVANGALLFFSTIESELVTTSLSYLESQIQTNLTKAMETMEEALQQAN